MLIAAACGESISGSLPTDTVSTDGSTGDGGDDGIVIEEPTETTGTDDSGSDDSGSDDSGTDDSGADDSGTDDSGTDDSGPDEGPGAVSDLTSVKEATIQIQATGTSVQPEQGDSLDVGRGSGFFISSDGIAVTNNHVVTGAAFLEVWVAGEEEPRRAKVLGVSECSDLAVIDVDGDGFSYLEGYDGAIEVGLPVFSAGFPRGNPEFTLTSGIISKAKAGGESSWASVDSVVEHDARINGGNSGGPLVTEDGKVVAVNYAGNIQTDQNFAITMVDAGSIIDTMVGGENVDSLGLNAEALAAGDSTGLWVYSVETGSVADQAGIKAGDFIIELEGLPMAHDGTLKVYCDILRTRGADAEYSIEVLRLSTGEVLAGNVNGSQPLEVTFQIDSGGGADGGGVEEGGDPYASYVRVGDDGNNFELSIPEGWSDVLTDGVESKAFGTRPGLLAASNVDEFTGTWDTPGVAAFYINGEGAPAGAAAGADLLFEAESAACETAGDPDSLEVGEFVAELRTLGGCGGQDTTLIIVALGLPGEADYTMIEIQAITDADIDAAVQIIASYDTV